MSTTPEALATTNGLCATHDFIRPGEEAIYDQLTDSVFNDLAPAGILEITLADEICRAMWRLRRCGIVEENFATLGAQTDMPDPMQIESQARIQLSVDRARSQAHRLLHKCTAELRKFQTERMYRNESLEAGTDLSAFGVCDWQSIQTRLIKNTTATRRRQKIEVKAELDALLRSGSSCKSAESPAPAMPRAA